MLIALLIIHILIAVLLILSIMLQSGQAGGLGGAFGGGGGGGTPGQSLFGGRGAGDFLGKATTYLGSAFLVVSFLLAFVQAHTSANSQGGRNILRDMYEGSGQAEQAPAPNQTPGMTEGEGLLPAGDGTETPVVDPAAAGGQTDTPPATGGDDGSGN
jgi:preprotein translocase subunit SecG